MLTLFSTPKPYQGESDILQRNALASWLQLGRNVQILLIGDDAGTADVARDFGVGHLPDVARNERGTPRVDSIFDMAKRHAQYPILLYVNADIILFEDILVAAKDVAGQMVPYLMVGQRWDLGVDHLLDFGPGWESQLKDRLRVEGRLHPPGGSDYFVFPVDCFGEMPPFAVGRAGWDNWMIYHARKKRWPVVDATHAVTIVHQDHDYQHLPGGQPHYRLPETDENLRMAGGRRRVFRIGDADYRLEGGRVKPRPLTWRRWLQEIERAPALWMKSDWLANLVYVLFRPVRAWREVRGMIGYRFRKDDQPASSGREVR